MTGRLLTGGGALLTRITTWWTADGIRSGIARIIGTLLAIAAGGGVLLAAPGLWWPLAAGWLIACWYAKPALAETAEQDDPGEFLRILHQLLADRKGAHLVEIAEHFTGDPAATGVVRELCASAGIPIADGVRVGRKVSTGIRTRDLPPLPDHSPDGPVGVVAAGQDSNNNSNTVARVVRRTGAGADSYGVEWDEPATVSA
jgi:hypothetical protein